MSVKGRSFGQERPPLTDLLKNILLRYPDGGQILKELIQNADDAGATEVKFLYDGTTYGTSSLAADPELARFQGPALYCYNSAEFAKEDWDGLQRLMRSNKKDNPLKVGRFGIGFNSVYHITDLPSIVSGDRVAFLDPHEKYFVRGQPGQAFSTKEPLLTEYHDQFEPFHEIFDCRLNQGNHFKGTLFRFPLRTEPSKLSTKIYTKQMVMSLFESFQKESSIILHFLKNIESVGLYERENRGIISRIYGVKIPDGFKAQVRAKRNELTANITTNWDYSPTSVFYTLEVEEQHEGKASKNRKWFMASQVGTNDERLINLAKELDLLPWISIAFPVDTAEVTLHRGRVFCFLPLPPDAECRSGLPVQVNGYFGLTDNRRSLKWPGPDCQNDDTAEWNQFLLGTLGSRVYVYLIENMVKSISTTSIPAFGIPSHANLVYSAIPRVCDVKEDWRCLLEPFCIELLKKNIFYTAASGKSRWLNLGEAVLDRLDQSEDVKEVVLSTLLRSGQPVVTIPRNVLEVVDNYSTKSGWETIRIISPTLVRDVLRSSKKFRGSSVATKEKLVLLEYTLQDSPSNAHDLHGVPLLPLENGEFCVFQNFKKTSTSDTTKVFITCEKYRMALLPNAKHRLLRESLSQKLKQKLSQLTSCDHSGVLPTQLFSLTKNDVLQLLWENFPDEWSCDQYQEKRVVSWSPGEKSHPPETWLPLIWQWIREQYPNDLSRLEGMPLIPLSVNSGGFRKSLGRLVRHSSTIFASFPTHKDALSSSLCQLLIASGCYIVEQLPSYLKHEQILEYVAPPTSQGLLRVLMVAGRENVLKQLSSSRNEQKLQLRSLFAKLTTLSADETSFILALPIFRAIDGKHFLSCIVNKGKRTVAPPNLSFLTDTHILDQKNIISSSDEGSLLLLKRLGMRIENTAGLLITRLEQYLRSSAYNDQEKNNLMLWVLERMEILAEENVTFIDFLCRLSFVPTASGTRKPPCEIYDHCDEVLRNLMLDNPDAFPAKYFFDAMKKRKSHLQLRCRDNLTAKDVLQITTIKSSSPNNSLKKGKALLYLLNERPSILTEKMPCGSLLRDKLSDIEWVPRVVHRPDKYPHFMPWYDGGSLCKPNNMCPNSLALLVGASVSIFDEKQVNKAVQDVLSVSSNYNFAQVVKQLSLAIKTWNREVTKPSGMELAKFQELLKNVYRECSNKPRNIVQQSLDEARLSEWIWHGDGFTSPRKVAFLSRFPSNISLYPHLFLLPRDFVDLKDFLLTFGVKDEFTDDDLFSVLWSIKEKHDNMEVDAPLAIQDLDSCRVILEWLVRDRQPLSDDGQSKLLIPVQTSPGILRLEPCDECTYCDREFLRQGGSEFNVADTFNLIHKSIPDDLAGSLGVPRLSRCLSGAEPMGYEIEEAGQYEPLTTRLRNILQEYKEGVAIFKELIQNADDAAASKVCFVMDWRNTPGERLLSPEMAKCQGPALWAYNNATFSKRDFESINMLAGETKKDDLDKIGRFGLGFNAVYHLTDVPSFISAEYFVAFDPNMNHIQDIVGMASRPGLKINLANNTNVLSLFPDQFLPYNNLFGCNTRNPTSGSFPYKGTLFRFPLRTQEQAKQSKISQNHYNRDDMCHIFESLKKSSSALLLFAQNVKLVRVFEIRNGSDPTSALAEPIMSISKGVEKTLHSNSADKDGEGTFLRNVSNWWKILSMSTHASKLEMDEGPRRTELLKITVSVKESELTNTEKPIKQQETWLVNSCSGKSTSVEVAESSKGRNNGLLPISGAAVKLLFSNPQGEILHNNAKILEVPGEVFCFLPLSFSSGLPVHVNGYFSVHSNRRGIWEEGVGEHEAMKPFEAKWNAALMDDALARSYLQLLEVVKLHADKQYVFHSLWPNPRLVSHAAAWKPFIDAFFGKMIQERLSLFYCNKEWQALEDCFILDSNLSEMHECVAIMNVLNVNVLSIPEWFLEGFQSCAETAIIEERTLTEERFLREWFFPNVAKIPTNMRNSVLYHVLDLRLSKHREYDDLFHRFVCFNCSIDGKTLRKPSELVHPRGNVACLFSDQEKRFPVDEEFLTKERTMMLEELGMIVNHLSWDGLCERAEWISKSGSKKRERAVFLVKYLVQCLESPSWSEPTAHHKARLSAAKFLPFLEEPKEYPVPWKGNDVSSKSLFSANNLYPDRLKSLVGSSRLILDESSVGSLKKVKSVLGLNSKQPKISDILIQLDHVIDHVKCTSKTREAVKVICAEIYDHFDKIASDGKKLSKKKVLVKELSCRSWILIKDQMISSNFVAIKWGDIDGSPYLYSLPDVYMPKYGNLVKICGVKQEFTLDDLLQAIWKLKQDTVDRKLSEQQLGVLLNFLQELFRNSDFKSVQNTILIPLPNRDCILYNSSELAINDAPWIEADSSILYVHERVPINLAYQCGAKPLIAAVVSASSEPIGQAFGQHECLTDRLKGILKSYPADEGILKELIQNADDAKANEIHFVFDPRSHRSQKVFNDKWNELQGPAICVYNDQRFTKEDIQGIQNLGIGSKVDDAEKTGQYGIGFNAVYHFTDCPSFLSDDEILCISDPHQRYVPGASDQYPGRLFNQLDKTRRNFQDVFLGFLSEFFNLKGGTMFRFPLRRFGEFRSKISSKCFAQNEIRQLFTTFRNAARQMLLFLNNIKNISISEIKNGKLETYSVSCSVSDEEKRRNFSRKITQYKKTPTVQIPWQVIHYTMTISDTDNIKQTWLISQSLGYKKLPSDDLPIPDDMPIPGDLSVTDDLSIPNGAKWGLLPRAGIAACLESSIPSELHHAFCFLPLPVSIGLPVHVNGHFALDSARRDLWHDPKPSDERTSWNDFVKRQVVAPTYASLICESRAHIKDIVEISHSEGSFASELNAQDGLHWYHNLFPSIVRDDRWKIVGEAFYMFLSHEAKRVLPVAQSVPKRLEFLSLLEHLSSPKEASACKPVPIAWCDVAEVFFRDDEIKDTLEKSFLDVGLPLLSHTPSKVYFGFDSCKKATKVSPAVVIDYLRTRSHLKDQVPTNVKNTVLTNYSITTALVQYCSKDEAFFPKLQGLPLLLTQDDVLRCFAVHSPVFCSEFSDLLPSKPELFLHKHVAIIFQSHLNKCQGIVKEFDIPQLAKFKEVLFPIDWEGSSHHPWRRTEGGELVPSKKWVKRVWKLIDHLSSAKKEDNILEDIIAWPIIPTEQGCLVPVSISKTVLNVSSLINSDTNVDGSRRKLLSKVGCPQLSYNLMPSRTRLSGSMAVLNHYLAKIQCPEDVLGLLDYTFNLTDNPQRNFNDDEIMVLLMFLQTDACNLSKSLLKNLPFYRTIDGKFISLSSCHTFYEVPGAVPLRDCDILSEVAKCVFLRQAPALRDIYKHIGIDEISPLLFYLSIVFQHFHHLSLAGRVCHLEFIRDELLQRLPTKQLDYRKLVNALTVLPFITNSSGTLHCASDFYDASNDVFAAFEPEERFPPPPFNSGNWKDFLRKVGLKTVVTQEQFAAYAKRVACEVLKPSSLLQDKIYSMSRLLVSCLFARNISLLDHQFLQRISKIKFVPAATIEKTLLAIHPAYGVPSGNANTNYIQFHGSVISDHKKLVWSSAPLLSPESTPTGRSQAHLVKQLNIYTKPPHASVLSHIKNISGRFDVTKAKQISSALRYTLGRVMDKLYTYLQKCCPRGDNSSSPDLCSRECQMARDSLHDVPFIRVGEGILVRGKQLVFKGSHKRLEPHIFDVPREITQYEHFLKRLGAQEWPTPRQYAGVLHALKESCEEDEMHPVERNIALAAVRGLFNSLYRDKYDQNESLANIQILYLPTEDCYLKPSTELLVNDSMEQKDRLEKYLPVLLVDFSEKDKERADKLVELLPDHLNLQKLSTQVKNQLSPGCIDKLCVLEKGDVDQGGCAFIQRYRQLMCSPEFSDALIRLFKFQENVPRVPENKEKSLKAMETSLSLCCMQSIETRLVSVTTGEPTAGRETEVGCFCQNVCGGFKILIKHGERESSVLHNALSSFVNNITGRLLNEEKWRFVMMMLETKDPAEISSVLDEARVPKSITSSWEEPSPGEIIPGHFHYLLKSDMDYHLREGELVGYDIKEEDVDHDPVYIYAKIIEQTNEGEGNFKFTSRYKIDIGKDEPLEVNKHRLYKFDRQGTKMSKKTGRDIVPYEGAEGSATTETPSKPTTLEEAKKEVAEALKEIWKLPESERNGAIRRLVKRWHPDKNLDCQDLANEVTKFLLNEVERLMKGGTPGYREPGCQDPDRPHTGRPQSGCNFDFAGYSRSYGRRARRNRQRYDEWQDRRSHQSSANTTEPPSKDEARKWLRQADADLNAARFLFESGNTTFYAMTCFHCHQTAEKCLKALLFANGLIKKIDLEEHEVILLAYRASQVDQSLRHLPQLVNGLHDYYFKTRYPEYNRRFQDPTIPSEKFTVNHADSALSQAKNIYQLIKNFLGI